MYALKAIGNKEGLENLHRIAEKNGGKCLSTEYRKSYNKYLFQCAKGHEWETLIGTIRSGSWCPFCSREQPRKRRTIEDMQELAKQRGGRCLSKEYVSTARNLLWECKNKHTWQAKANYIENGHWCTQCQKDELGKEMLKRMHRIAKERKGMCRSTSYEKSFKKLNWECEYGHQWSATPGSISKGSWCPVCAKEHTKSHITIEDIKQLATSRGGKCLSDTFVNNFTKLEWECAEGHQWFAIPGDIKAGSWCQSCSVKKRKPSTLDIKEMNKWAAEKGGRCLSNTYVNLETELIWQCINEHVWIDTPHSIHQGKWCPKCRPSRKKRRNITIFDMKEIAVRHGGDCLSTDYVSLRGKLLWKCKDGHKWHASLREVRGGAWCPHCFEERRKQKNYNISVMHKWAKKFEGVCLSQTYLGYSTNLEWQCNLGHIWEAPPCAVNEGHWCPDCSNKTGPHL